MNDIRMKYRVILASASPRRKEILSKTGIPFETIVSGCDENINIKEPDRLVTELARLKALDVFKGNKDALVIGSDTVVAHRGKIMGKPETREHAFRMIRDFAGDTHQVYTGVCVAVPDGRIFNYNICTNVNVTELSDEEIERYLDSGEYKDKAGAYAIQGLFAPYISSIEGDYYNVVGLPISSLYGILKEFIWN